MVAEAPTHVEGNHGTPSSFFLALGIWIARGYPLTRAAHARILSQLEARNRAG